MVQFYLHDDFSSVTTCEKSLRGCERIHLRAGECATVQFTLTPEHLSLFNRSHEWVVEPDRFTVQIGLSGEDIRATVSLEISDGADVRGENAPKAGKHDPT